MVVVVHKSHWKALLSCGHVHHDMDENRMQVENRYVVAIDDDGGEGEHNTNDEVVLQSICVEESCDDIDDNDHSH